MREYVITEALHSYRSLLLIGDEMGVSELERAILLERRGKRRPTMIKKLITLAVKEYKRQLEEDYKIVHYEKTHS